MILWIKLAVIGAVLVGVLLFVVGGVIAARKKKEEDEEAEEEDKNSTFKCRCMNPRGHGQRPMCRCMQGSECRGRCSSPDLYKHDLRYTFIPHMNSLGGNIEYKPDLMGNDVDMMLRCSASPRCAGFNTNGYFKDRIRPLQWMNRWSDNPDQGLFVKRIGPPLSSR